MYFSAILIQKNCRGIFLEAAIFRVVFQYLFLYFELRKAKPMVRALLFSRKKRYMAKNSYNNLLFSSKPKKTTETFLARKTSAKQLNSLVFPL